jgi:hypothetical protein
MIFGEETGRDCEGLLTGSKMHRHFDVVKSLVSGDLTLTHHDASNFG